MGHVVAELNYALQIAHGRLTALIYQELIDFYEKVAWIIQSMQLFY